MHGGAVRPAACTRGATAHRHRAGRTDPRSTVNETHVPVVGNVVDSPRRFSPDGGNPVTNFRMTSTARRFDNRTQEFVDGGTFWVDVECWNELSGNVYGSVSKGDPVIVQGTLTTHSWEGENGRRSTPRIRALRHRHGQRQQGRPRHRPGPPDAAQGGGRDGAAHPAGDRGARRRPQPPPRPPPLQAPPAGPRRRRGSPAGAGPGRRGERILL